MNAFGQPVRTFNPENPMVRMDGVALFLCAIVLIGAMLTVLASSKYLEHVHSNWGEFYTLVLSSVTGMMFLAAASDLLMLFLVARADEHPGVRARRLPARVAALERVGGEVLPDRLVRVGAPAVRLVACSTARPGRWC